MAYKKVYLLFVKKKVKFYNIVLILIIFTFNIPVKFLKLSYYFIVKNNEDFRTGLEFLFFDTYKLIKNLKIEVLDRKFYLNCHTKGKLCRELLRNNSLITEDNFIKGIQALRNQVNLFDDFENRQNKRIRMNLILGKDDKDRKIFSPHYGYFEKNTTIHSTSNILFKIRNDQIIDVPMPSLIKSNAINPGSIVSLQVNKVIKLDSYKIISRFELDAVKYNHQDKFKLEIDDYNYMISKDDAFRNILNNYFKIEKIDSVFMKELKANNYTFALLNDDNDSFIKEYIDFYKDDE